MKEAISIFLVTIVFISCSYKDSKKPVIDSQEEENDNSLNQEIPTNRIHAWSDGCGFSFELPEDKI